MEEIQQRSDPTDGLDVIWKLPKQLGEGWYRNIQLRDGLSLWIENSRVYDDLLLEFSEYERSLEYLFRLSGCDRWQNFSVSTGQHTLYGSGLALKDSCEVSAVQPFLEVEVRIQPEILHAFVGSSAGELPPALQLLTQSFDQQSCWFYQLDVLREVKE